MQRLDQLARAAVGFDATRGDEVVIENVSFSSNAPDASPVGMAKVMDETNGLLHAQPGLLKTVCFAALSLLLILTVVRPMSRHMMTALTQPRLPAVTTEAAEARSRAKTLGATVPGFVLPKRPSDTQGIYEQISEQIRREPAQSTRLLESWINAPVEDGD
jgi:flagellar M-ring protein FliF